MWVWRLLGAIWGSLHNNMAVSSAVSGDCGSICSRNFAVNIRDFLEEPACFHWIVIRCSRVEFYLSVWGYDFKKSK